jgi:hypothetical protein
MMRYRFLLFAFLLSLMKGTSAQSESQIEHMPTSPEAALSALEDAYRDRDIEAAVALKDFFTEAQLMLGQLPAGQLSGDAEILAQTAEILELSFRKEIRDNGFPKFSGLYCRVVDKKTNADGLVHLTEECRNLGIILSRQYLIASFREGKWRIVGLADENGEYL